MPITALRPAKTFTLTALGSGSPLTTTAINGYQDEMEHLAGRGGYCQTAIASRVNGQVHPIVGVKGDPNGNAWLQGYIAREFIIPIGAGMDTMTILMGYRLLATIADNAAPLGFWGATVRLQLIINGSSQQVYFDDWRGTMGFAFGANEVQLTVRLADLFKLPATSPAYMALVLTFDSSEGRYQDGLTYSGGGFTNPSFYMGVDYLSFAVYRNCEDC